MGRAAVEATVAAWAIAVRARAGIARDMLQRRRVARQDDRDAAVSCKALTHAAADIPDGAPKLFRTLVGHEHVIASVSANDSAGRHGAIARGLTLAVGVFRGFVELRACQV